MQILTQDTTFKNFCKVNTKLGNEIKDVQPSGPPLGQGSFGDVYDIGDDKVLKVFNQTCSTNMKLREAAMIKLKPHKHIVKTFNCATFGDQDAIIQEKVVMLGNNGDLFDYVQSKSPNTRLEDAELKSFIVQLISGMNYLHINGYKHNDLKLENILITTEGSEKILKIADFGLSHHDDWSYTKRTHTPGNKQIIKFGSLQNKGGLYPYFGTESYLPSYDLVIDALAFKRDEWALGVMIYMLSYSSMLYRNFKDTLYGNPPRSRLFDVGPRKQFKYFANLFNIKPRGTESIMQLFISENPKTIIEVAKGLNIT